MSLKSNKPFHKSTNVYINYASSNNQGIHEQALTPTPPKEISFFFFFFFFLSTNKLHKENFHKALSSAQIKHPETALSQRNPRQQRIIPNFLPALCPRKEQSHFSTFSM